MSLYVDTLRSDRWRELKWRRIMAAEFRCERCDRRYVGRRVREAMKFFQLHHRHYDSVGFEDLGDVLIVCRTCHRLEHDLIPDAL